MIIGPTRWTTRTELEFAQYGNGAIAMIANDPDTGQVALKLTVNLEGLDPPWCRDDQVWLKTWAENEGVPEALVAAGIVTLPGLKFPVNPWGSEAVLATLTPAAAAELERVRGAA